MSEQFSIGEIAVIQNQVGEASILNGAECIVRSPWQWHRCYTSGTGEDCDVYGYEVDVIGQFDGAVFRLSELRKKRPPQSDTGETRIRELFDKPPVVQPELELA